MDPNMNLYRQIVLATRILREEGGTGISSADAGELAELVTSLDNWIRHGGFLPTDWKVGK